MKVEIKIPKGWRKLSRRELLVDKKSTDFAVIWGMIGHSSARCKCMVIRRIKRRGK